MTLIRILVIVAVLYVPHLTFGQQWESMQMPILVGANQITSIKDTFILQNDKCLYKSTDNGISWQSIAFDDYTIAGFYPDTFRHAYYYLNGSNLLYQSDDFGMNWVVYGQMPVPGSNIGLVFAEDYVYAYDENLILRHALNGPLNAWGTLLEIPQDTFAGARVLDLKRVGGDLWAATTIGIRYSNNDGATWSDPLNKVKSCQIAEQGNIILVNYTSGTPQLYRSLDQGVSWQLVNPTIKPDKIFDSGGYFLAEKTNSLYRSTDGITWEKILESPFPVTYEDVLHHNGRLLTAYTSETDVNSYLISLLRSTNDGETWLHCTEGLTCGSTYGGFAPLQIIDGYLVGGTSYGYSEDQGNTWTRPFIEYGPSSDIIQLSNEYVGFEGQYFYRCSANGRFEWKRVHSGIYFNNLVSLNGLLYGSEGSKLYRSADAGSTWIQVGTLLSGALATSHGKLVSLKDSSCIISTNEGATWTKSYTFANVATCSTCRLFGYNDSLFLSYSPGKLLFFSADGGLSFDTLITPVNSGSATFRLGSSGDNLCLWLGGNQLHFTIDNGQNWLTVPMPMGYSISNNLDHLAIDKSSVYTSELIKMIGWRLRLDNLRNVSGKVFIDANQNSIQDPGETDAANILVTSSQTLNRTNGLGRFTLTLDQDADTIRVANLPPYFESVPAFFISQNGDSQPVIFGLRPLDTISDIGISLVSAAPFRAGFKTILTATLSNNGTVAQSGAIKIKLDALTMFTTATPAVSTQSGDTLIWNYSNLKPFEKKSYTIEIATAIVTPGTPLTLQALASLNQDFQQSDNLFVLNAQVVSSYDPNDKVVTPVEVPIAEVNNQQLTYTIRFQNLGNIATDFVVIRDTLSEYLDASTIRILSASHSYAWNIKDGNALEFRFSPIILTPATIDETNSQGFIQFAVKMKPGIAVEDVVSNTAHIYFDFNPAVITNTVKTTVKQFVSTIQRLKTNKILIFPNPSNQSVLLQIDSPIPIQSPLSVWDTQGKLVWQGYASSPEVQVSTTEFTNGTYFVRWINGKTTYVGQFIVQHP
jgi:uncharacterized repeat protein (TIGR01451 family)